MKLNNRKVAGLAAVALTFSLALTGCGKGAGDSTTASGSKTETITFIPKNLGNPYFDTSDKGGASAVKEFKDSLTKARKAGTKVVTFDSDTDPQYRDIFVNQATADGIAKVEVDMIAQQIGDKGDVAILSAAANATNQNAWIAIMKKEFADNHPNIKLVATVYGNDDDQTSFDKTSALLQKYPNLKGIISPTTVGIAAAARYLSTSSKKGKVALTGLGTPNQMRKYVKDGTVTEFALWNPADLGYLAAYVAHALVSKEITGKEGDKFKAGKLGEYTVGKDGTVLLGDPFKFNKSNIDKFNF
jgi:rhamnose transport system substrate-binding protein